MLLNRSSGDSYVPKAWELGLRDYLGVWDLVCLLQKLPQPQGRSTEMPHFGKACLRMFFSVEPNDKPVSCVGRCVSTEKATRKGDLW